MPFNYNTQGITNPDANDPRNLGGSEGYGNPTASGSSGIMSSTANTTSNDDDNEPSFFESIANLFSGAGADLPSDNNDDGDSGASFYSGPMFGPFNNGSDDSGSDNNSSSTSPPNKPLPTPATDRALYEALGIDVPEVYRGELGEWEPEPNIDMDVLQKALQPDPITVEELEVKAGDTLTAIAEEKGLPVQAVIDANPQIKNPDLIRPGEVVSLPAAQAEIGQARASIMPAQQEIGQARAAIIMKGIDKLFGMFPPKTKEEKAAKSELEYFLDAQPDSVLPDLFKYIPDAVQVQEYLKGRADRKMEGLARESAELAASERDAAGIARSLTPEEVKKRNAALKAASEDPDRKFYQSTIPIEDRTFPAEAEQADGIMTRPKARPEGLDALDEKERIKAVQTIIGTKADGAFGKGSKAKLKAWQYVHGVPTTGELDDATMEALKDPDTYDPREITRDDFIQTPTFDLLKGVEGFEEDAYLGKISADYKSGLTVGAGIDFGQHTRQALLDKGLPVAMVDKADAAGWVGLNPDTIIDPLTGNPVSQGSGSKAQRRARGETLLKAKLSEQKTAGTFPEFTFEELAASTPTMYKPYEDAAKKDYDRVEGDGSFDSLSEGTKAALATEKYHRGESYDISYMFAGASSDNPILAAEGIRDAGRRRNMKDWLRKVGLDN
jgi:LysM repeat protein